MPITVSWGTSRKVLAQAAGVVTSVEHATGLAIAAGEVLYRVNLQPVTAMLGDVPAFRALKEGVTGPDVGQVQSFLTASGFYTGPVDGKFRFETTRAVKAWQTSIGAVADGVVDSGDVIFLASLPARGEVLVSVGDIAAAGTEAIRLLPDVPDFVALMTPAQLVDVPSGQAVTIEGPQGQEWEGSTGPATEAEDGNYSVVLGGALCGLDCASIPLAGSTRLDGRATLVAPATGPVVPTSALISGPDGSMSVRLADGAEANVVTLPSEPA
jgi:peptidoglycan hydrolase-like protein with peptidoglycan-binding domain